MITKLSVCLKAYLHNFIPLSRVSIKISQYAVSRIIFLYIDRITLYRTRFRLFLYIIPSFDMKVKNIFLSFDILIIIGK